MKDNLQNLLGRVYDRFVKIKYQQSVKEKVAAQKARLVNTKKKVKQNIRQRLQGGSRRIG